MERCWSGFGGKANNIGRQAAFVKLDRYTLKELFSGILE